MMTKNRGKKIVIDGLNSHATKKNQWADNDVVWGCRWSMFSYIWKWK